MADVNRCAENIRSDLGVDSVKAFYIQYHASINKRVCIIDTMMIISSCYPLLRKAWEQRDFLEIVSVWFQGTQAEPYTA